MKRIVAVLVLAGALGGLAACDDASGGSCSLTGNGRVWGACCTADPECESNLCFQFGDGSRLCTIHCTTNEECPVGSQGRKCNRQGVCRP